MVLGVDDQESEHHGVLAAAESLAGMPVLVADLHSALPAIVAGIRAVDEDLRVAYVLSDGAAAACGVLAGRRRAQGGRMDRRRA